MRSPPEGPASVVRARRSIESALGLPPRDPDGPARNDGAWSEKAGIFVTLKTYPDDELRGCVGFPRPILPRGEAIDRAARAAALEDPRFPPIVPDELARTIVEVSWLTAPERLGDGASAGGSLARAVVVGRDGLIVSAPGTSGLLLPQVAVEQRWDAERFLAATCEKAGLSPGAWRRPGVRVERFAAWVFAEPAPGAPARAVPGSASGDEGPRVARER